MDEFIRISKEETKAVKEQSKSLKLNVLFAYLNILCKKYIYDRFSR